MLSSCAANAGSDVQLGNHPPSPHAVDIGSDARPSNCSDSTSAISFGTDHTNKPQYADPQGPDHIRPGVGHGQQEGGSVPAPPTLASNCLTTSTGRTSNLHLGRLRSVPGGFVNLTKVDVPLSVSTLLSYGPKFCVPKAPTFSQYIAQFFHVDKISLQQHKDASQYLRGFIQNSCHWMLDYEHTEQGPVAHQLCLMYKRTRQFLGDHPELTLVQGDKSKSTVLMYATDYQEKMDVMISKYVDRGVFVPMPDLDLVRRLKIGWYRQYNMMKKELVAEWNAAGEDVKPFPGPLLGVLNKTNQDNKPLPYMYGVVKDHKEGAPCRPICSTRGWYSWALQKIITHVLTHATADILSDINVKDVNKVAHHIRSLRLSPGNVFIKLDVSDMYTMMERSEIMGVLTRFVESPVFLARGRLPGQMMLRCLEMCLGDKSLFTFNGLVYRQVCGLPQGAPDSGLLACILLDYTIQAHHHAIFIQNSVLLCHKYVDDLLFYLPADKQLSLMTTIQSCLGLAFTSEEEETGVSVIHEQSSTDEISFLDIGIVRDKNMVYTRSYRKSMASTRTVHYLSNAPNVWKENTLSCSLAKVLDRSSNPYVLADIRTVEEAYRENMYPMLLIQERISQAVARHVADCVAVQRVGSSNSHLTSLGCLVERVRILGVYPSVTPTRSAPQKRFKVGSTGFTAPVKRFASSIPYLRCEMSEVVSEWYRSLSLGKLTHKNVGTLFSLLRMHKRSADPTSPPMRFEDGCVALLSCGQCDVAFLVRCGPDGMTSELKSSLKRNSSLQKHEAQTGHIGILDQEPMVLQLSRLSDIPAHAQVALMQAVFNTLGYECRTVDELVLLPLIVRMGLEGYLRKYGPPHLAAW